MTQLKHNAATRVSHYANATGVDVLTGERRGRGTIKGYGAGAAPSASLASIWLGYTSTRIAGAAKGTRED